MRDAEGAHPADVAEWPVEAARATVVREARMNSLPDSGDQSFGRQEPTSGSQPNFSSPERSIFSIRRADSTARSCRRNNRLRTTQRSEGSRTTTAEESVCKAAGWRFRA